MGTILVDLDAVNFLGVDIAGDVVTLFNHRNFVAPLGCFARKDSTEKTCTNDVTPEIGTI
ncbi:hypothetical protein ME801_09070 [Lactobacillus delbrueckii]|nr:hypothetical protein ME801_09070 [Lactobacillus delbrueckii]